MAHNFGVFCFLLLCCSFNRVTSENCGKNPERHRTVKFGIYYTQTYYKLWEAKGGRRQDIFTSAKALMSELSELFSEKHFAPNSVTFTISKKNLREISQNDFMPYMSGDLSNSVFQFCRNKAYKLRKYNNQDWDIAFIFMAKEERNGASAYGVVSQMRGYCGDINCGMITESENRKNVPTFGMYPKLLAHEVGHSLGFPHDWDCNEEPCEKGASTIMNSPGSKGSYWSSWSKRILNRQLSDPKTYRCLKWKCNKKWGKTGTILDNKADLEVLNKVCYSAYGDPRYPFKVDDIMTDEQHKDFLRGYRKKSSLYYRTLSKNKDWYLVKNVCKGLPCKARTTRGTIAFLAWSQDELENEPCGVNKVCQSGKCVEKSARKYRRRYRYY